MLQAPAFQATKVSPVRLRPPRLWLLAGILRKSFHHGRGSGGNLHSPIFRSVNWTPHATGLIGTGVIVQPRYDVGKDNLDVLVGLAGRQAMPHPGVELNGLVSAAGFLVQCSAHFRVCHCVCLPMQYKEWKRYLKKRKKEKSQAYISQWVHKAQ